MLKKVLCAAIAVGLLAANNGSCMGGGVNSAGDVATPTRVCEAASRVGAAADVIAQALIAARLTPAKIAALLPLIQEGRFIVTATCAIVAPPAVDAGTAPVAPGTT